MDLKDQVKIVSTAEKYTNTAGKFLAAELGREVMEQDIVTFASALSAIFGSWVYHRVYAGSGPEAADLFLNQIFLQLAASVRQRGAPVVLKISHTAIPTENGKEVEKLVIEKPGDLCACVTDAEGRCRSCEEKMRGSIEKLSGFARENIAMRGVDSCKVCFRALVDPVFADVVRSERFVSMPPEAKNMVIATIVQGTQAMGVGPMPLVEKALAEAR